MKVSNSPSERINYCMIAMVDLYRVYLENLKMMVWTKGEEVKSFSKLISKLMNSVFRSLTGTKEKRGLNGLSSVTKTEVCIRRLGFKI